MNPIHPLITEVDLPADRRRCQQPVQSFPMEDHGSLAATGTALAVACGGTLHVHRLTVGILGKTLVVTTCESCDSTGDANGNV